MYIRIYSAPNLNNITTSDPHTFDDISVTCIRCWSTMRVTFDGFYRMPSSVSHPATVRHRHLVTCDGSRMEPTGHTDPARQRCYETISSGSLFFRHRWKLSNPILIYHPPTVRDHSSLVFSFFLIHPSLSIVFLSFFLLRTHRACARRALGPTAASDSTRK